MIFLDDVRTLLVTFFTGKTPETGVWADFVPESADLPGVAIINVANPISRDLEGVKTDATSIYRLELVTESTSNMKTLLEQLNELDNTTDDKFQRIHTELINVEAKEPNQPVRRAFIDLTLYER